MTRNEAVTKAACAAYDNDFTQSVGQLPDGSWAWAHWDDLGAQREWRGTFPVYSDGERL